MAVVPYGGLQLAIHAIPQRPVNWQRSAVARKPTQVAYHHGMDADPASNTVVLVQVLRATMAWHRGSVWRCC